MKERLIELAKEIGFEQVNECPIEAMIPMDAVRDMCAADKCRMYGKTWSCPPALPALEEYAEIFKDYSYGILVQTVCELEDDFDIETMEEGSEAQKERFSEFAAKAKELQPDCFPMSSGTCTICEKCTYPDAPCRFPETLYPSMEACGLWVSDVCNRSNVKYYYGPGTLAYTAVILFK